MKIYGNNESEDFAFNSKMHLKAMRKIQREVGTNRHGKAEKRQTINGREISMKRKRRQTDQQNTTTATVKPASLVEMASNLECNGRNGKMIINHRETQNAF